MAALKCPLIQGVRGFESLRDGLQTTRGITRWLLLEQAVTFGGSLFSGGFIYNQDLKPCTRGDWGPARAAAGGWGLGGQQLRTDRAEPRAEKLCWSMDCAGCGWVWTRGILWDPGTAPGLRTPVHSAGEVRTGARSDGRGLVLRLGPGGGCHFSRPSSA